MRQRSLQLGDEAAVVTGVGDDAVAEPRSQRLGVGDGRLAEAEQGAYLGPLPLQGPV